MSGQQKPQEKMIRACRVLIVEGPESWVNQTLARSLVQPDRPYLCVGSMYEVARVIETGPFPGDPVDPPTLQNTGHDDPPTLR